MPKRFRFRAILVVASGCVLAALNPPATAQSQFNGRGPLKPAPGGPDVAAFDTSVIPTDPAARVAVVGESSILLGDVKSKVDAKIREVTERVGQQIPQEQIDYARANLTRGTLSQLIQQKMLRESFLTEQVSGQSADKRKEADQIMNQRARAMFMESEVPALLEQYQVQSMVELDTALRQKGSSLGARRRDFVEQMLGHLYIRSKVNRDPNVTLAEISRRYQETLAEYDEPAKARWEQISVLFENHPDREEASRLIASLGAEAFYGGSMKAVARKGSEEPFASDGGQHDWTARGALASKILEQQIFAIPLGRMSEIIADETGLHIIRVLERRPAGRAPLSSVQDEIRGQLRQEKILASQAKVMQEIQNNVPVWSIFPEDVPGAKPLPVGVSRIATSPTGSVAR